MNTAHTPPPWRVERGTGNASGLYTILSATDAVIVFQMKVEANANVIAAAPRMLELLKQLTTANKGSIPWAKVHAVIAEAEGRT